MIIVPPDWTPDFEEELIRILIEEYRQANGLIKSAFESPWTKCDEDLIDAEKSARKLAERIKDAMYRPKVKLAVIPDDKTTKTNATAWCGPSDQILHMKV